MAGLRAAGPREGGAGWQEQGGEPGCPEESSWMRCDSEPLPPVRCVPRWFPGRWGSVRSSNLECVRRVREPPGCCAGRDAPTGADGGEGWRPFPRPVWAHKPAAASGLAWLPGGGPTVATKGCPPGGGQDTQVTYYVTVRQCGPRVRRARASSWPRAASAPGRQQAGRHVYKGQRDGLGVPNPAGGLAWSSGPKQRGM